MSNSLEKTTSMFTLLLLAGSKIISIKGDKPASLATTSVEEPAVFQYFACKLNPGWIMETIGFFPQMAYW